MTIERIRVRKVKTFYSESEHIHYAAAGLDESINKFIRENRDLNWELEPPVFARTDYNYSILQQMNYYAYENVEIK